MVVILFFNLVQEVEGNMKEESYTSWTVARNDEAAIGMLATAMLKMAARGTSTAEAKRMKQTLGRPMLW